MTPWPSEARASRKNARACDGIGQADESGRPRARVRKQFQRRRGDDPERALGADEEVLQVVAGIVLAQFGERFDDPPVGEHDLEPGREIAGIAVGEHRDAARVGREVAADRAGSLRGERQRKQAVGALRGGLSLRERHAGLDDHRVGERIDLANAVHPPQREHDRRAAAVGGLAADEPGVAALRHDRRARRRAGADDGRDLRGRARANHRERAAMIEAARFAEIARHQVGIGENVRRRDDAPPAKTSVRPVRELGSTEHSLRAPSSRADAETLRGFRDGVKSGTGQAA